jgi:hypothetical protein
MIATGRPYGLWRDIVFHRLAPKTLFGRTLADAGAFTVFQLPIYAATLIVAGAKADEVLILLVAVTPQMLLFSRPFGLYLDVMRRLFRVSGAR